MPKMAFKYILKYGVELGNWDHESYHLLPSLVLVHTHTCIIRRKHINKTCRYILHKANNIRISKSKNYNMKQILHQIVYIQAYKFYKTHNHFLTYENGMIQKPTYS